MTQLAEELTSELDEMLDLGDPKCDFPKVRNVVRKFWIVTFTRVSIKPENGPCGKPGVVRVRMTCLCTTQLAWACSEHLAVLQNPNPGFRCSVGHPATIKVL